MGVRRACLRARAVSLTRPCVAGIETGPGRRAAGDPAQLSPAHMRVDERMLEERPQGAPAVHRHLRPATERHETSRTRQPAAPTTRASCHRRPLELVEDSTGRPTATAGRRLLPGARPPGPVPVRWAAAAVIERPLPSARPSVRPVARMFLRRQGHAGSAVPLILLLRSRPCATISRSAQQQL